MKIGTMSQQKRPDKMKRPRFLNCEEVPRQIVSSAMAQVLSHWRRSTSADGVAASSFQSRKLPALSYWTHVLHPLSRYGKVCHSEPRRRRGTSHLQVMPTPAGKHALHLRGPSARFASLRMTMLGAPSPFIAIVPKEALNT